MPAKFEKEAASRHLIWFAPMSAKEIFLSYFIVLLVILISLFLMG